MHNNHRHNNFRDAARELDRKEPTASEHNNAQLINWLAEVKSEVSKFTGIMNEYRLQQMKIVMELKDFINKLASEKVDISRTMEMILQHLTAPGQLTNYQGAVMPSEDAIALKVADLLKRPYLIHKSLESSPSGINTPETPLSLDNIPDREDAPPASDEGEKINTPIRRRITYSKRMDEMMLEIMQQQGGEWNTNKLIDAMIAKYPHTTFKKPSVATAFNILMNAGTIFRVDRGMYQAKEVARG